MARRSCRRPSGPLGRPSRPQKCLVLSCLRGETPHDGGRDGSAERARGRLRRQGRLHPDVAGEGAEDRRVRRQRRGFCLVFERFSAVSGRFEAVQRRFAASFWGRGIPASMYTLALDNAALLERLLELGADPQVRDKKGNTLLHYAAGYGRADFLPFLLDRGLKELLKAENEDGQTPLDVARLNLSQERVADAVRPVIQQLKEVGAVGKITTDEDEARFEKAREEKIAEEQVNKARSALKALAMAAQKQEPVEPVQEENGDLLDQRVKSPLNASLERIRNLDTEELRQRLGGKMSEEQLERLSERLSTMSPEDLAKFAAGLPSVKAEVEAKERRQEEQSEKQRESASASTVHRLFNMSNMPFLYFSLSEA